MKDSTRRLIGNIGIFTIAGFSTKILSFVLLPLYTSFLTTDEYGTLDLVLTLINLVLPIFTLSVSDAVLRFGINEKGEPEKILRVGVRYVMVGMFPMGLFSLVYAAISKDADLGIFTLLIYSVTSVTTLFSSYAKAIDRSKEMSVISVVVSALVLGINVLLVAVFRLGITGYFLSILIGNGVGIVLYLEFCGIKKHLKKCFFIQADGDLRKSMLLYSIPLIPNSIFWWINSSLDRWTLTVISGVSFVGLYAVAGKIPNVISNINGIFFQAWNISIFESNETDRTKHFEKMYSLYTDLLFFCSLVIIVFSKLIARYAFAGDFFSAWRIVPFLTVGVFINSLNTILGSMFTANKDTKRIFSTTLIGSITNCLLNIPFVIYWNVYGAAIATAISYFIVYFIRTIKVKKLYGARLNIVKQCLYLLIICSVSAGILFVGGK